VLRQHQRERSVPSLKRTSSRTIVRNLISINLSAAEDVVEAAIGARGVEVEIVEIVIAAHEESEEIVVTVALVAVVTKMISARMMIASQRFSQRKAEMVKDDVDVVVAIAGDVASVESEVYKTVVKVDAASVNRESRWWLIRKHGSTLALELIKVYQSRLSRSRLYQVAELEQMRFIA
jgi:hypothetical protein